MISTKCVSHTNTPEINYEKIIIFSINPRFQNGKELGLWEWEQVDTTLSSYVQIGDSISKSRGEYSLFVYKKNGTAKKFKCVNDNE